MHDENNDEKSFTIVLNSEDIKKKTKKVLIDAKIKKNISKISFYFMCSKIYQLFLQKKTDFSRRMQEIKNEIH